jgi:hypothetical protein
MGTLCGRFSDWLLPTVITEQQRPVLRQNPKLRNETMFSSLFPPKFPPDSLSQNDAWFSRLVRFFNQTSHATIALFTEESESKIYLSRNENGTIAWSIYDSTSSQFPSETEARSGLKHFDNL